MGIGIEVGIGLGILQLWRALALDRTLERICPGCSTLVSLCCRLSFALYLPLDIIPSIADANTV